MTKSDAEAGAHMVQNSFFSAGLADVDPEIADAIAKELNRQRDEIELIASENIVSAPCSKPKARCMTNKYAEGYPGKRYYGGCQFVDIAENARDRARHAACSAATSPMCSRIPAARPTRRCSWRCCSRAIPSWVSTSPPADI